MGDSTSSTPLVTMSQSDDGGDPRETDTQSTLEDGPAAALLKLVQQATGERPTGIHSSNALDRHFRSFTSKMNTDSALLPPDKSTTPEQVTDCVKEIARFLDRHPRTSPIGRILLDSCGLAKPTAPADAQDFAKKYGITAST